NINTYSFPVLSLEEALSCIPPPVTYSPKCTTSKTTTKINGDPPTSVLLWKDFFEEVNRFRFDQQPRFERPQFIPDKVVLNEEDVRVAIDINICLVLNRLTGLEYDFSKRPTHTLGIPDFTCHYLVESLILVLEVKRKHVLKDIKEQTFPEFYQADEKARMVIQQIYNYMGVNELRYSILATYDNHWFLRREHTELWISKTLPLQSESPPVLKAYAYLARQAKEDPQSLNPLRVPVPAHGDSNSRVLRSQSNLPDISSSQSVNQQPTSNTSVYQQSPNQQNLSFADFKFKSILGEGRSGKTLLCTFRGETIALKSVDLSKAPPYVLEEMQKEVEIYKDLADIQGKYIPKLVCYGYYGGGMSFVIGMTIAGTSLSEHKITKRQRTKALKGLEAIHKHGILHNDIREENILINDNGDVYLIDFGMAGRADIKKKRKLFDEEQLKFSNLLDKYNAHFVDVGLVIHATS
ncbi:1399_t:CDS:2, partial [Ambispora gerdemannii]